MPRILVIILILAFPAFMPVVAHAQEPVEVMPDSVVVSPVVAPAEEGLEEDELETDEAPLPQDTPFLRTIPPKELAAAKADPAFVYANDPTYWKQPEKSAGKSFWDILDRDTVKWILYGIMAVIFLGALYYIVSQQKLSFFTPGGKQKTPQSEEEKDGVLADYGLLSREAEQNNDWRTAIRFRFLELLRLLDERGAIHFSPDASNFSYARQISENIKGGDGQAAGLFRKVARIYEYAWYGNFAISGEQYRKAVEEIRSLSKMAGR